MSLFTMSTIARFTRNEMVEVIDSDYVRLAESKGCTADGWCGGMCCAMR